MSKNSFFDLDGEISIPGSVGALKRWCRKNKIKIKRAPFTFGAYVFYLDDLFGVGKAEVTARSLFGKITELSVMYRALLLGKKTVAESFNEVNYALISRFGSPDDSGGSIEGDDAYCRWYVDNIKIAHYIFERFGAMEYLRIELL